MTPSLRGPLSVLAIAAGFFSCTTVALAQVADCTEVAEGQCCDPATGDLTPIDDGDVCTTDTCNDDGTVGNAVPAGQCCDPTTGDLTPIDDGDICTTDSCNDDGTVGHVDDPTLRVTAAVVSQVEAGLDAGATIAVNISCGTAPFVVERETLSGPADPTFDGTDDPADGREITAVYTPPDDSSGVVVLQITVTDADGQQETSVVSITVCTAGSGSLCAVFLTNLQLIGVVDFRPEIVNDDGEIIDPGTTGTRLVVPNLAVASILSQLDIDGDGLADNAPDTDGDGLPDNWEIGGFEAQTADGQNDFDRIVFYPAPTAIVPGTPPTPIFTRLSVATSALSPDSDGDGLSDFIEVFGLMFIDENKNGLLDSNEWADLNEAVDDAGNRSSDPDGLPSPGEYPLNNSGESFRADGVALRHDFDGFVFTDPTNDDTDGDGVVDGEDNDPLINPRAFGIAGTILVRFNAEGNADIDQDGLGNGMDMGNDITSADSDQGTTVLNFEVIDNPQNVEELLRFFRRDLLEAAVIPESAIEDLLGADWDGNGLWRSTDVRTWSIVIADDTNEALEELTTPPASLFKIGNHELYARQTFDDLAAIFNAPDYKVYGGVNTRAGQIADRIGLGWQDLLQPPAGVRTDFIPDQLVWSILYSWRVPGFDIDGDGFVGVPNLSSTFSVDVDQDGNTLPDEVVTAALQRTAGTGEFQLSSMVALAAEARAAGFDFEPFDDRIAIGEPVGEAPNSDLDGQITPPPGFPTFSSCGAFSFLPMLAIVLGLMGFRGVRRRL